jgi:hypothetical protein
VVEAMPRINWNLLGPTRCGEYSHVDTAPRAAQWLDLMILQESKGVRPAVGGQVSDLIQKNGAGVRFSHPSFKVAIGTGVQLDRPFCKNSKTTSSNDCQSMPRSMLIGRLLLSLT